jgi:hypothetical protein
MKKWFTVMVFSMALAGVAYAHCGKCGMDGAEAGSAHSGVQCPMHAEKNTVLTDAAKALETSNPDLSAKLKDMAANCCAGH